MLAGEKGVLGTLPKTSSESKEAGLKLTGESELEEEELSEDAEDDEDEVGKPERDNGGGIPKGAPPRPRPAAGGITPDGTETGAETR